MRMGYTMLFFCMQRSLDIRRNTHSTSLPRPRNMGNIRLKLCGRSDSVKARSARYGGRRPLVLPQSRIRLFTLLDQNDDAPDGAQFRLSGLRATK